MARYQTLYREYEKWKKLGDHEDKTAAEREALDVVHLATYNKVIVVEQQPVIISRIERTTDGITMVYPKKIMDKDYQ